MSDKPTTGLRDLPLSQYLLRGRRSNAAAQYEELRRLQEEQAALTPLAAGPFRLFTFNNQEEKLRAGGKDRKGIVASLNQGVEVLRVEPTPEGSAGKVDGLVDQGRLRIVIGHEPEPPARANWRLLGVESGTPQGSPLALLTATWSASRGQRDAPAAGDAAAAFDQFTELVRRHRDWLSSWHPRVVSVPFLVFHLDRGLPRNAAMDRLFNGLRHGTALFDCRQQAQVKFESGRPVKLALYAPEYRALLIAYPPKFSDAGPNEWMVARVEDAPDDLTPVVQLEVRCHVFSRWVREQFRDALNPEGWLAELEHWHQHYDHWKLHNRPVQHLAGGFFNLRVSQHAHANLQRQHVSAEELCAAMNRGLRLYELIGRESDALVAVPDGLAFSIRLTPHKPSTGGSDWKLIDLWHAKSTLPCFARIDARWEEGGLGRPPALGDAARLIRELSVLQSRRQEVAQQIATGIERLAGMPPDLPERIACWRKVCDLEREKLEVGVTRLEREGQDFSLIPEEQETVEEWINSLESLNEEGVNWDRYPLELRLGEDHARLVILSVPVTKANWSELALRVGCDNPRGRALVERLCDGGAGESEGQDDVRLFLPDTQLRLIDSALSLLDPSRKSRAEWSRVVGEDLTPDDLSLRTLQAILASADELEPVTSDWPPLPIPPLAQLSPRQEEAVRAAVFGPDMTLIQGPPGTGKTTVILEILRQLFRMHGRAAGFKVLLVAPTHVAVDNVLERLVAPRQGGNLVMELGVAPYRVGSTRRIAEHLRGFTPDCLNTKYREDLEREVASAVEVARRDCQRDEQMLAALRDGEGCDVVSWASALTSGELLEPEEWDWPSSLDEKWQTAVATQAGRVRAWRHWHAKGSRPQERARLLQRWLDFLRRNPRFFSELLVANANLVCATTIGCATHRELRSVVYDYVIVDEAGKEEARRLLVPLIRGERWVLVGDHQQLPPYADDGLQALLKRKGLDPAMVTRSLFEELQGPFENRGCYVFLDRQGRMHPDISAFVSERFYGGQLHDFPHAATHSLPRPSFLPETPALLVLDTRRLPDREETRWQTGYVNVLEQDLALYILRAFAGLPQFREGCLSEIPTVGVIAPYRLQVEDIARRARKDSPLETLLRKGVLHVGTVDSFQGQERDLILFTCTRSNPAGRLGFVDNRQRLNVALSRARCRLIVIADGQAVEEARFRADASGVEAETRDHLHALFAFAGDRNGVVEVPGDWRTRWRG